MTVSDLDSGIYFEFLCPKLLYGMDLLMNYLPITI
jgi:hypothetical protein